VIPSIGIVVLLIIVAYQFVPLPAIVGLISTYFGSPPIRRRRRPPLPDVTTPDRKLDNCDYSVR
jgi:hypothetical protein